MTKKEYYMSLSYPIIIKDFYDEGERVFSAEIKELPGLIVYGDSLEEVYSDIELAKADWIEANIEWGREIQEPFLQHDDSCSGRVTLRLPKSLHRKIKERAFEDGVSLNQEIVQLINDGFYNQLLKKSQGSLHDIDKFKEYMLDNAYAAGQFQVVQKVFRLESQNENSVYFESNPRKSTLEDARIVKKENFRVK